MTPKDGSAHELERLREMFEQAPGAMAILRGPLHVFELVNPAYSELIGHRDVIGKPVIDALPEVNEQGFIAMLDRVRATGEAHVGKGVAVSLRRSPGAALEDRYLDFVYQPLRDPSGEVTGIFVAAADVTDRKLTEEALRQSETRFRQLIEASPAGVAISERDGTIILANDELLRIMGYTRAEFERGELDWRRSTPPEYLHHDVHHMDELRSGGSPPAFEKEFIRRDGSRVAVLIIARFIPGEEERMVAFALDITQRKQAEESLRATERRLSRIFETNLLGLLYFGIDGDVFDANDELLRIIGYTREDLREGKVDWSRMTPQEFKAQDDRAVQELRRTGAHAPIEKQYLRKDGSRVWILVGSAMVDVAMGVGFVLDLSGVKEAEDALREADRRKDEFLATLSHELRNPLAPIRSALELLKRSPSTEPTLRSATEIIGRQIHHMVRLVDDLLDVSRITLGQVNLRRENVDLTAVLNDAIESARPAIRTAKHRFRVELPTQPMELVGDSTRLSQVFQNLLDNAAKYTPSGGDIDLSVEEAGHRARVRIRDTGIGIPAELQTRIFELFTRVHPSENIKTSGLGIGLSLAKKLVELHGGQLEVRSEGLDKGSEFIVTLPLVATSHVLPDTNAAATSTQSTTKRVLVVDDNRDAAQSLGMLIEVMGSEVRVAFDGAKALEIAKELDPNIVLLDIGMPGMDGYEVARRLRSSARGGEMTIVALTGWGQKEDKQKAFDAGFDKHFTKPIDMNALAELVG